MGMGNFRGSGHQACLSQSPCQAGLTPLAPEGQPGAGGYREHDIFIIIDAGAENITNFPYGPEHLIIKG